MKKTKNSTTQKKQSKKGKEKDAKSPKSNPKPVSKAELIKATAELRAANIPETSLFVEAFLEVVMAELESGNDVLLTGFGKFVVRERPERKRKNLYLYKENPDVKKEDTIVTVRADRTVSFKLSNKFKARMNPGSDKSSQEPD